MGMRDQDMGDRLAVERLEQGREMGLVERSRIDHRHIALADDVGACAGEGERLGLLAMTRRSSGETSRTAPYSNSSSRSKGMSSLMSLTVVVWIAHHITCAHGYHSV